MAEPFDLARRAGRPGVPAAAPRRVWADAEQAERLATYLEVPRDLWEALRPGEHVRYYTRAGEYRNGGFVFANPFQAAPGGGPTRTFMKLRNGFNPKAPGYADWLVDYEETSQIFVKPSAAALIVQRQLHDTVEAINANLQRTAEFASALEARLAALEARARR